MRPLEEEESGIGFKVLRSSVLVRPAMDLEPVAVRTDRQTEAISGLRE